MRYRVKHDLQTWRKIAKLTQTDVANALRASGLKTTQTTVSHWESGKAYPNALEIAELEKLLKIRWSDDIILPKE